MLGLGPLPCSGCFLSSDVHAWNNAVCAPSAAVSQSLLANPELSFNDIQTHDLQNPKQQEARRYNSDFGVPELQAALVDKIQKENGLTGVQTPFRV